MSTLGWAVTAQTPNRIPSTPEEQIFNLIKRVTALEERNAVLEKQILSDGKRLAIRAPFEVVDANGWPILQVEDDGSTRGMSFYDGPAGVEGGEVAVVFLGRDADGDQTIQIDNGPYQIALTAGSEPSLLIGNDQVDEDKAAISLGIVDSRTALAFRNKTDEILLLGIGDAGGELFLADAEGAGVVRLVPDSSKASDATVVIGKGGVRYHEKGEVMAALGVDSDGAGLVLATDGKLQTQMTKGVFSVASVTGSSRAGFGVDQGQSFLSLLSESGIPIATLVLKPAGALLELGDSNGDRVVGAGVSPQGGNVCIADEKGPMCLSTRRLPGFSP